MIVATGNVTDQLAKGACQYDSTLGVIKLRTDTDARRSDTDSALIFRCLHDVYRLRGTVLSCRVQNGQVGVSRDQGTVERKQDGRSPGERDGTGGLLAGSGSSAHRIRQHRPFALTG